MIGLVLFSLRRHRRDVYGALEIAFAVVVTLLLVFRPSGSDASNVIGLLTAIYVLVRGLDNLHLGLSPDRRARWFWGYLRDREVANLPAEAAPSGDLPQK